MDELSIIYPQTLHYDFLFQRPQQLIRQFARMGLKCYFENPGSLGGIPSVEEREPNLLLLNNRSGAEFSVGKNTIFYFTGPWHVMLAREYKRLGCFIWFDSVDGPEDEFISWKEYYGDSLKIADLVTCTSSKLYASASKLASNVLLVENAADFSHFNFTPDRVRPTDLPEAKHIVGYHGALAPWVDWGLVDFIANSLPEVLFTFIGPPYSMSKFPQRKNLLYLGEKPYREVSRYVREFDVCIIPFKISEMIKSCNPIKMWEYMATGKPIVTTSFPEALKYGDLLYHTNDPGYFVSLLSELLSGTETDKIKSARVDLARNNSWESRAETIISKIKELI